MPNKEWSFLLLGGVVAHQDLRGTTTLPFAFQARYTDLHPRVVRVTNNATAETEVHLSMRIPLSAVSGDLVEFLPETSTLGLGNRAKI